MILMREQAGYGHQIIKSAMQSKVIIGIGYLFNTVHMTEADIRKKSYIHLSELIEYVKSIAWDGAKIAFNMTWVGEPTYKYEEIVYYGGNQLLIYEKIARMTEELILPMKGLDRVSPTGTAIQNARTSEIGILTCDGYHLTTDIGCYIAGMTFLKALTGVDLNNISWAPEGTDNYAKRVAIESANNVVDTPFPITQSKIEK